MEFKVGDKIRAKPSCDNDWKGGEGIIVEKCGNNVKVFVTKSSKYYSQEQAITSSWLLEYSDLLEEDSTKTEIKKDKPIVLHLVLKDNCKNIIGGVQNNFDEAQKQIPLNADSHTIYKLIPVAQAVGKLNVTKIK